jgi:hypothetical protein
LHGVRGIHTGTHELGFLGIKNRIFQIEYISSHSKCFQSASLTRAGVVVSWWVGGWWALSTEYSVLLLLCTGHLAEGAERAFRARPLTREKLAIAPLAGVSSRRIASKSTAVMHCNRQSPLATFSRSHPAYHPPILPAILSFISTNHTPTTVLLIPAVIHNGQGRQL